MQRSGAVSREQGVRVRAPGAISFTHHGARCLVRVPEPEMVSRVAPYLPMGRRAGVDGDPHAIFSLTKAPGGTSDTCWQLASDEAIILCSASLQEALEQLESAINLAVAAASTEKIFVHAGVVVWHGRAIIIPGRTCFGKTTLVRALVDAGARYASDDLAVFDESGWVYPYLKPLGQRCHGAIAQTRIPLDDVPGSHVTEPAPAALVVVTRFVDGASWQATALSPAETVFALLEHTGSARSQPDQALRTLKQVGLRAVGLKSDRGEAATLAPQLLAACDDVGRAWESGFLSE